MTISRTPRSYDQVRPLYERAVFEGDKVRQSTIELDNLIDRTRQLFTHTNDFDVQEAITGLDTARIEALHHISHDLHANFTDIGRLLSTSNFMDEKLFMPLLFGTNTRRVQMLREKLADGTESKSIEIVEILLNALAELSQDVQARPGDRDQLRGAIQEATAAALLNYRQDGRFIVLPTSLKDDVSSGIDLDAFYIAENGQGYKAPISIKSSRDNAIKEKRRRPGVVVLAAGDFDNHNLSISRLLVQRDAGYPGIDEAEAAKLEAAQHAIYQKFYEQANDARVIELPRHSAQATLARFQKMTDFKIKPT